MLTEIIGDILDKTDGIICHQVNYYGSMGGGLAAAIREILLTDDEYQKYVDYCALYEKGGILGSVLFLAGKTGCTIANMFCQDDDRPFTTSVLAPLTDYTSMYYCFYHIRSMADWVKRPVYIPHNIGCGIAGGNWVIVKDIISDIFSGSPVPAYIVTRTKGVKS